jgi:hypothetical protein
MALSSKAPVHLRIGRLFLYAVIGFFLIILAVQLPIDTDQLVRWTGLVGGTAVLFWNLVKRAEPSDRTRQFWLLFSVLLAIHCVALVLVMTRLPQFKPIWLIAMIAEYPLLMSARNMIIARSKIVRERP